MVYGLPTFPPTKEFRKSDLFRKEILESPHLLSLSIETPTEISN